VQLAQDFVKRPLPPLLHIKRQKAGEELVQDNPERIDVGACVNVPDRLVPGSYIPACPQLLPPE